MPQLDTATFPSQLFWLLVTFVVLYGLMRWLALPQVGRVLENRRHRLDDDLSRAAKLKSQAETVLADYRAALAAGRSEAQAILRQGAEQLAAEAAERQRELAAALSGQIEAAEQRIAAMKDDALAQMHGIAIDVGGAVVERLTGLRADAGKLAAAVDAVSGERAA